MTSHAAVVARGWGKPCICGCNGITIDEKSNSMTMRYKINDEEELEVLVRAGEWISLNGDTGEFTVFKIVIIFVLCYTITIAIDLTITKNHTNNIRTNHQTMSHYFIGEVLLGKQILKPPVLESSGDTHTFMKWVDEKRKIRVLANAGMFYSSREFHRKFSVYLLIL